MHVEQRAWYALVDAHNTLGRCRMLLLYVIPDDDFIHQLLFGVTKFLVVALGAR